MAASLIADLTRAVTLNGFALNAVTVSAGVLTGCRVDTFDPSEVQVRQYTEPLALAQGLDVGGVWYGGRIVKMTGTLYGATRGGAMDLLAQLEAVADPEVIYAATPTSFGFVPLTWYVMTAAGQVLRTLNVRPNGLQVVTRRDWFGGVDAGPLAIAWALTAIAKNPVIA